jgi:hypothetical protein
MPAGDLGLHRGTVGGRTVIERRLIHIDDLHEEREEFPEGSALNDKHLLGLINTVLDIAKIESGEFTPNMTEYAIKIVVETVRAATESLAQSKKLAPK